MRKNWFNKPPTGFSSIFIVVSVQVVEVVVFHFGKRRALGFVTIMKTIEIVFFVVVISIRIEGSDLVVEEVVDNQLIDVVGHFLVLSIFVNSESGESLDFLENIWFVIKYLNGIEPRLRNGALLGNFENDFMSNEKSFLWLNQMKSQFEICIHILIVPIRVGLFFKQSGEIDSIPDFRVNWTITHLIHR